MPRWSASRIACSVLAGVGRDVGGIFAVEVDAAQAFGDRPAVQGAPHLQQRLSEQFEHAGFVRRLDHDQRRVGADQCGKVPQFTQRSSDGRA